MAGALLDGCRHSLVHYDHRHPHRDAVLQIRLPGLLSLWKGNRIRGGAISLLANILWLVISGIPLAAAAALNGVILCCTVIGIPFGLQCFKIAKLALMPFGATVR